MNPADVNLSISPEAIIIFPYDEASGDYNMARDTELATISHNDRRTYIRFYGWNPYAVSLGHNQSDNAFDLSKLAESGIEITRRPTGGRAVFHSEELTYSIVTPTSGAAYNRHIYRQTHLAVAEALQGFGVSTDYVKSGASIRDHYKTGLEKACFTSSARYELTIDSRKIVGSAQRDFGDVLLQHGSILLGSSHLKIVEFMLFEDNTKPQQIADPSEIKATDSKKLRFRNILNKSSTDVKSATGVDLAADLLADKLTFILPKYISKPMLHQ